MKFFIPAWIWAGLIFGVSVMPGSSLPKFSFAEFIQPDKIGHFGVYMVLVMLTFAGFKKRDGRIPDKRKKVQIILYIILYGISIEVIQQFLTDRHFDVLDIIANIIGCCTGLTIVNYLNRKL